ncbi:MAG: hypothetical protein Q8O59_02470 [bacterium]|nr:hypothetical protein [bacterium]
MSEWDKKRYYGEQARPAQPCQAIDSAYHKKYRPKEQFVCQISHVSISLGNPQLRFFLVRKEMVPVNAQAFLDFCLTAGWPMPCPEIWQKAEFEIEPFLVARVVECTNLSAGQVDYKLKVVNNFARLIGLKINLQP